MKQLTVISGKGGTGKTSLVASFAALAGEAVLADCDVDAPDLALVLAPQIQRVTSFAGGKLASINVDRCILCQLCAELCRFGAVSLKRPGNGDVDQAYQVDPLACVGCGVCAEFCPENAVNLVSVENGRLFVSRTRHGPMVHAQLGIAQDNSGKLVSLVRREAKALAEAEARALIICDGPPGIGCPVIAAIGGADLLLVVAEPSVAALHDMERMIALADRFRVPAVTCINKFDLNEEMTEQVEAACRDRGVAVIGRIPYDESVITAQLNETSVVEQSDGAASKAIKAIWQQTVAILGYLHWPVQVNEFAVKA